ncbi:UNVERIFIED_CONTAM: hypothetical protein HDU68_001992 [Siphonaria sp. JEL0065]|nr:hypothetical protein HDU68_001992 [Siphonaria sp. JEL0065]
MFDSEHGKLSELLQTGGPNASSEVQARLAVLEKAVSDAQLFLPAYDVRRCVQLLADLSTAVTKEKEKGRKKFAFKSKLPPKTTASPPPTTPTATTIPSEKQQETFLPPPNATVFANATDATLQPTTTITGSSTTDSPPDVSSSEVYLSNLTNCIVDLRLLSPVGAVHIKSALNCVILCGGIKGSVLIDGMKNSTLVSACRQFRMHNSTNSRILLHVSSKPIIEDCDKIIFGPYVGGTILLEDLSKEGKTTSSNNNNNSSNEEPPLSIPDWLDIVTRAELGLVEGSNGRWFQVEDFNWLKSTASPHWRKVATGQEQECEQGEEGKDVLNELTMDEARVLNLSVSEACRVQF